MKLTQNDKDVLLHPYLARFIQKALNERKIFFLLNDKTETSDVDFVWNEIQSMANDKILESKRGEFILGIESAFLYNKIEYFYIGKSLIKIKSVARFVNIGIKEKKKKH